MNGDTGERDSRHEHRSMSPLPTRVRSAPLAAENCTGQSPPNILRTSSLHTPTPLPEEDKIIESWISQSLAIPSTTTGEGTNNNNATNEEQTDTPVITNVTIPNIGYHRRDGSLDSFVNLLGPQLVAPQANPNEGSSPHPYGNGSHILSVSSSTKAVWGSSSVMDESFYSMDFIGGASLSSSLAASASSGFAGLPHRRGSMGDESLASNSHHSSAISSEIHDAARILNWQTVADLCQKIPEAAGYIGTDGWTALHHACNRRCPYPKVVESLIKAYPDALLIAEEKGWLPLHYACRFKAPKDVVKLLLHMHPEKGKVGVSRPDRKGRSPLYYAVRYDAPSGVVGLLIDMDASAVLEEDQNADSPLALVWDDWAEKLDGKRTLQKILWGDEEGNLDINTAASSTGTKSFETKSFEIINPLHHNATGTTTAKVSMDDRIERAKEVRKRLERQTKVLEMWKKVNIFLKAAFGFPLNEDWELEETTRLEEEEKKDTQEEDRKWRVLHAISAIKCHHTLFLLAMSLHPEQAFDLDRNDLRRIDNIYNNSRDGNQSNPPSNLTALHLAASSHAGGDSGRMVVNQLMSLNPGAVKVVDTEGSTPLHRIVENKFKSEWDGDAVEDIYASNTHAISIADVNGRLPLHRAAIAIAYFPRKLGVDVVVSRSVICRLLEEHNDAASTPDNFGCLPLHLLAQNGSEWDAQVQAVYDANPSAVQVRTGVKFGNRLPLHLAAANANAEVSLIGKLLEYNPRAASQADRKGLYPMHLACQSGLSWTGCVQSIHESFPGAVEQAEQNKRGWHALHMAASSEHSDGELLSKLIELYPQAAAKKDADDRYPLHLACKTDKDWEDGLSCLFDANAHAIQRPDKEGMLPLHIVAFRYCSKPPSLFSPKVTDIRSRRLSRNSEALEKERLTEKEKKEARELTNIFEMLKADPTVLQI